MGRLSQPMEAAMLLEQQARRAGIALFVDTNGQLRYLNKRAMLRHQQLLIRLRWYRKEICELLVTSAL